jgi:hypothetical protein
VSSTAKALLSAVVCVVLACEMHTPKPAFAENGDAVEAAYVAAAQAYERGLYKQVIRQLRPLLYPKNRLSSKDMFIQAHRMLGISYVFEKDKLAAEQSFLAILAENPKFRLDPLVDPAAALRTFETIRIRSAQMLRRIELAQQAEKKRHAAEQKRREQALARLREMARKASKLRTVEREIVKRPAWLNVVPFGAGQFQNGHRIKGYVLLGTQLALGAASLSLFMTHEFKRPFAVEDRNLSTSLRTATLITGALFWATVVYGVVDGFVYHKPASVTERVTERKLSLTLTPTAGPRGGGLQLGVTF